jgi:hypothetical protein
MSAQRLTIDDSELVATQTGRPPRTPWRVAARCRFERPTVIASPSRLDDGTPFPTLFWLTCPHLAEKVAALESAGEAARWARRATEDPQLAAELRAADAAVREARAAESGGEDACASVGLAGQRDPLGVKCLHAHVAAALAGIADPVGAGVLSATPRECSDDRCARLAEGASR